MNYFEHHIGDYAEATAHLSFVEDAAYSRCIRKYYAKEKPLPADVKAVQRLVGARTKEEKDAVEAVLNEFFILAEDGWRNARCDADIAAYQAGEPEREARKANETARVQRHRDERATLFQQLNAAGQHAHWNIGMRELRALVEALQVGSPVTDSAAPETPTVTGAVTPPVTAPVTPATATHTPIPNTHTPLPIVNINTMSAPPPGYPADFDEAWEAYPSRPGASKKDSHKAWAARIKAGATAAEILAGVRRYADFVLYSRTEPQFIKQPATFFGPGEHFKADWAVATGPQKGQKHDNFSAQDYRAGVRADGSF